MQNVTTYGTVIDVPNPQLKLKPGMTANVKVEIAKRTDVLRVPNAALRFRPTAEVFAALNQAVPPEAQARRRPRRTRTVRDADGGTDGAPRSSAEPAAARAATRAAPPSAPATRRSRGDGAAPSDGGGSTDGGRGGSGRAARASIRRA